jgi:hypothetical protein
MKTRREFIYDFGSLSFAILLSNPLIKKWISSEHKLECFKFDHKADQDKQIKVCFLGVGHTGTWVGEKLAKHVGVNIQFAQLSGNDVRPSLINRSLWQQILEKNINDQDITVLVGNVDDPVFLGIRQFLISRVSCLWTIGILSEDLEMDTLALNYDSKEIMRLVRHSSSIFHDMENLMQSIFAIYLVQHKYIYDEDYQEICREAFEEFGL